MLMSSDFSKYSIMAQREKEYRECEECGELIESGNPTVRLCKRCAAVYQNKRRPKNSKKKRKGKKDVEYFDAYDFDYDRRQNRKKKKRRRKEEEFYEDYEEEYR